MTPTQTKSVKVLTREPGLYVQREEETGEILCAVTIGVDDMADMGEPRQITVTIEPGDMLKPTGEATFCLACSDLLSDDAACWSCDFGPEPRS